MEEDMPRMVKTPWFEEEIPFAKAAEIGTRKVIKDHSTVGIVVTTDGSVTDISREAYLEAEKNTIEELQGLHKPFLVLVNTNKPYSEDANRIAIDISGKYGVKALPMNCQQMKKEDVQMILENLLYEFPISAMEFYMPKWVEMLSNEHPFKQSLMNSIRDITKDVSVMRDIIENPVTLENENVKHCVTEHIGMENGIIRFVRPEACPHHKPLREMEIKPFGEAYDNFTGLCEFGEVE